MYLNYMSQKALISTTIIKTIIILTIDFIESELVSIIRQCIFISQEVLVSGARDL